MPGLSFPSGAPRKPCPPSPVAWGAQGGGSLLRGWLGWLVYPCSGDEGGIFKGRDRVRISDEDGYLLRLDGTSPSLPTDMCRLVVQVGCQAWRGPGKPGKPPFASRGSVSTPGRAPAAIPFVQMRSSEFGIST